MKYASAMYFGGELIDATDADYDSYKDLGLLCPNCKSPVFLQAVSKRHYVDKIIEIPAHFKHFQAKDPALAKECEARVARYDAKELKRRASQARNQRLRILQRRFWDIFSEYYDNFLAKPPLNVLTILESISTPIMLMGNTLSIMFFDIKDTIHKEYIKENIENLFNEKKIAFCYGRDSDAISPLPGTQKHFIEVLTTKLDRQMQELVACEVLDFLHSKSSCPLVRKLFCLASLFIFKAMDNEIKIGLIGVNEKDLAQRMINGKINYVDLGFWHNGENQINIFYYTAMQIYSWISLLPWANMLKFNK